MNKFFAVVAILAAVFALVWVGRVSAPQTGVHDYKNTTYTINGQPVTLVNGKAETAAAPGSASTVVTQYFGNEATGDLNGNNIPDVAFLLTQTTGGSGTFYYVVAALGNGNGSYVGTNAVLLGDRIAPQTTEFQNGKIIVNYADRNAGEPMTTRPSVGVSKYFAVVGTTLTEQSATAGTNPGTVSAAGLKTYTNTTYGFSVQYPSSLSVKTSGYGSLHPFMSAPVAYIWASDGLQTAGYLTLNVSPQGLDVAHCTQPGAVYSQNSGTSMTSATTVQINSTSFSQADYSDGGGVSGLRRDYSTLRNGICYTVEISSSPSACVNSGCTNRQWSLKTETALLKKLDTIARSFRFSAAGTSGLEPGPTPFVATPTSGAAPLEVTFRAPLIVSQNEAASSLVGFGDGTTGVPTMQCTGGIGAPAVCTGAAVTHTYAKAGVYTAKLTTSNAVIASQTITVR